MDGVLPNFKLVGNARDTMPSMHNALATLIDDSTTVVWIIDLLAYRLVYGPGDDATTLTEGFLNKFPTRPYSNILALDYANADNIQALISQLVSQLAGLHRLVVRTS